jgi:hypothetical protein
MPAGKEAEHEERADKPRPANHQHMHSTLLSGIAPNAQPHLVGPNWYIDDPPLPCFRRIQSSILSRLRPTNSPDRS